MSDLPIGTKVTDHNGWDGEVVLPPSWPDLGYIVELTDSPGLRVLRYGAELTERDR